MPHRIYFTVWGDHEESYIAEHLVNVLEKVAVWDREVPAATEKECGNYKDHNLEEAKVLAAKWVEGIKKTGWNCCK